MTTSDTRLTDRACLGRIAIHPVNPRWLLIDGRAGVLVTSGEHYGALINADVDYLAYLSALKAARFNLTRVFCGAYVEGDRSLDYVGYGRNTLAPRPGRFMAPWGYDGMDRFDLETWNEEYFAQLKDVVRTAGERGIVVELVLFGNQYNEYTWRHSPLHPGNNVNVTQEVSWREATEAQSAVWPWCEKLVRRTVEEVRGFENVYIEPCNEAAESAGAREFVLRVATVVREVDPARLMGVPQWLRGFGNVIINAHYPASARRTLASGRGPVALDETAGVTVRQTASSARVEAWEHLIGGGAVYNGLSWEYSVLHLVPQSRGHFAMVRQLGLLRRLMDSLELQKYGPGEVKVKGGRGCVLSDGGDDWLVYVHQGMEGKLGYELSRETAKSEVRLELRRGPYRALWMEPARMVKVGQERFEHARGEKALLSPQYREDLLLRVRRLE